MLTKIRPLRFYPEYGFKTGSNVGYKPEAKCPKFLALLEQILPDAKDRRLLQMYLGGAFTGRNHTRRMLVMRGPTGSGKSTIMKIQETILGYGWVGDLRPEFLGSQFELSHSLDVRQMSAKDVAANTLSVQGAKHLKHLLGGDITQAEVKYGGKKRVSGNYFVVITSNSDLRIALENDEDAWLSRLLVLDFTKIAGQHFDLGYVDRLIKEEAPGILNFFLEGGMMYLREVRKHGDLRQTPAQTRRAENLVMASKSLEVFVTSKLVFCNGPDMTNDEVIKAYADFCKGRGWTPISSAVLYSQLPDLMLHKLGATKAANVVREGVRHKGYRNVSIKAS